MGELTVELLENAVNGAGAATAGHLHAELVGVVRHDGVFGWLSKKM